MPLSGENSRWQCRFDVDVSNMLVPASDRQLFVREAGQEALVPVGHRTSERRRPGKSPRGARESLEKNLLKYVWKHSRPQQLWMFIVVVCSMPLYFMSLDLPKRIVNGPVQGNGFEQPGQLQPYLQFDLPFGDWIAGHPVRVFDGISLDRQSMLLALCFTFLAMVFINGWFKLYINTYKGRMGERILRRMRYELFDRVLRYPIQRVRRVKPSEITSVIKDEVEPLGEFIGDAFTAPLFLGGQAITGLTFLFLQNYFFGFLTLGIVLFQAWLVPLLRRRLLVLGRQRQRAARALAGRIGESVQGMDDIHLNDTTNLARARISGMLGQIFLIRFELYQRKFSVKFINNFLIQFLAFLFYAVGGYFVINGSMDIGALVASIAAYKDLPTPIKGLIDWDQLRLMNQVRYGQAIEDFATTEVDPPERQRLAEGDIPKISDGFAAENLSIIDDSGTTLLESVASVLSRGETVALIGDTRSGVDRFAEALARLLPRSRGRILLDGTDLDDLPEYLTGRRIGYADSSTFFPDATILETVSEPLMNQPEAGHQPDTEDPVRKLALAETRRSGNFVGEVSSRWIDRDRIGIAGDEELQAHFRSVMESAGLFEDVLQLGLRRPLKENESDAVRERIVEARKRFSSEIDAGGLAPLVELLDPEHYNKQLSVGENIIFGTTKVTEDEAFSLVANREVREILQSTGAEKRLFEVGMDIAQTNIELFGDLADDSPMLEQAGAMTPDRIAELAAIVKEIGDKDFERVVVKNRDAILALTFDYIERESRFGLIDDDLQDAILVIRRNLHQRLEESESSLVQFFDPEDYNDLQSILDNILFGRIDTRRAGGQDRVITAITELIFKMDLTEPVFRAGLEFAIGTGARNLSDSQAQKLKVARALVKKPDILIFNRALVALEPESRKTVLDNVLKISGQPGKRQMGMLCVLVDAANADKFDRVIRFERGQITFDGKPDQLNVDKIMLEEEDERGSQG